MSKPPIKIAITQNRIQPDIRENGREIQLLMRKAKSEGATLIHFPENAMSGCAKAHIKSWERFDWDVLTAELHSVADLARDLEMWVVLGSAHRLTPPHRPHNSLYVISDRGEVATRYDKRFCSHTEITSWYTPGRESRVFEIKGWRFGCALCIEIQFPEVFREYAELDVDCILFSAYADDAMFGLQAQGYAASHGYWFSLSTPTQMSDGLCSRLIGPSGEVQSRAMSSKSVVVVDQLDERCPRWEVALKRARPWRANAREGSIYRPHYVHDARSDDRNSF